MKQWVVQIIKRARAGLVAIFINSLCFAGAEEQPKVLVELPFYDYPFSQSNPFKDPSYQQSLNITKSRYQLVHHTAAYYFGDEHPIWTTVGIVLFDVASPFPPYTIGWLHEEWHRAVLTNRKIGSHNAMYDSGGSTYASVNHIKDEDLERLKANHPAEMIQLHAAGFNAQAALSFALEKDAFFLNQSRWDLPLVWLNYVMNSYYLYACSSGEGDELIDEGFEEEGTDITARDFTGMDCNGWVYDLHRPTEPYASRGTHPSGVGIKRYIKTTDMTSEELDYLKLQTRLTLINLINPYLFGKTYFSAHNPFGGTPLRWNFSLSHRLAPFGYSVGSNILIKQGSWNLVVSGHIYKSRNQALPGIDVELFRYPVNLLNKPTHFSARTSLWLQPADLLFTSDDIRVGGAVSGKLNQTIYKRVGGFIEAALKTRGWQYDTLYLDSNISVRAGVSVALF